MMEPYITHGYNVRYEFDQNLNTIVTGEFCFETFKEINLYDSEGNFYKKECIYNRQTKSLKGTFENLGLRHCETVMQFNFDFIKVKSPFYSTVDDLHKIDWSKINSKVEYIFQDFPRNEDDNLKYAKAIEFTGFNTKSYQVNHNLGKGILDFNFEKYNENRIKAIQNKLDDEWFINHIFNTNLKMLSFYFMCSVDELKSKKFDIKKQIMKRLNFKINQKELEISKFRPASY